MDLGLAGKHALVTGSTAGKVEFAKPGSLPNDGKLIDDIRKYT